MSTKEFSFNSENEKKTYVREMFTNIARRYDFLNHFLSFGMDYYWRRSAVRTIRNAIRDINEPEILDIACGTGDLSFEILRQIPTAKITGVDLAEGMLELFRIKAVQQKKQILIQEGDVEALAIEDNIFNAITIGFATRNFSNLQKAFEEIYRVLKPGGIFVNLELSRPRNFPMKQLYSFYGRYILPTLGKLVSGNSEAYRYLPNSIAKFPEREMIVQMLTGVGFSGSRFEDLSSGIVTMHIGIKPKE